MDRQEIILIPSPHLQVIPIDNKRYAVYNTIFGNLRLLSEDAVYLIQQFKNGSNPKKVEKKVELKNFDMVISTFKDLLFLIPKGMDEYKEIDKRNKRNIQNISSGANVNYLRLTVTHKCNFKCKYCYVSISLKEMKKSNMKWAIAKKGIDAFYEIIKKNKKKKVGICFFGGEPLINWKVIKKALEYLEAKKPEGVDPYYIINTNGSLVTDEIAKTLKKYNTTVIVSLDGIGIYNDLNRMYPDGKGTYIDIITGIKKLLREGTYTTINTVITPNNIDGIEKFIRFMKKLGINRVSISPALFIDEGSDLMINQNVFVDKVSNIWDYARSLDMTVVGDWTACIPKFIGDEKGHFCSLGQELNISPNGNIHPCPSIYAIIGNVNNIRDMLKSKEFKSISSRLVGSIAKCRGCEIEGICRGGCAAEAKHLNGTIFSQPRCDFIKLLTTKTLLKFIKQKILTVPGIE